jgi:AGCS family alanine or glycine:cation symporter
MEEFSSLISGIAGFMWGWPLLVLLLGTHLFLTIRLKFIQRHMGTAIRLSVKKDPDSKGEISQFSALATSLAATIGTGNIIGVATAVTLGGPGAVLWVWITGVLGIATKYGEGLLAVKYRKQNADGTFSGGPMYALEYGLKSKFLAVLFAVFTAIAAFGIGASVQANAMAETLTESFGANKWITGIVLCVLVGVIIIGGLKSIARVCDKLIPFMAVFYVAGCLIILVLGYETLLTSLALIVKSAFTGHAATGGFAGSTVMMAARYGVARGLFSNESGLGSAPIVAAAAKTRNPVRQALVSSSGTFWDTVIICALTGLVLVNTGAWNSGQGSAHVTQHAFGLAFAGYGRYFLCISLVTFSFSTIIGWAYYAEKAVEYLWGVKSVIYYKVLYLVMVFVGTVLSIEVVWNIGDMFNGLMAVPNLIALLLLSGVIVSETKKYLWSGSLDVSEDVKDTGRK